MSLRNTEIGSGRASAGHALHNWYLLEAEAG
jgi:hypothetical protein